MHGTYPVVFPLSCVAATGAPPLPPFSPVFWEAR